MEGKRGAAIAVIDRVAHAGVWGSGALLVLAAVVIGVDVIARKAFGISLGGSDEVGGYVLAISSAWAFSFTLLKRGHIRIDAVYNRTPARLRIAFDLIAFLAFGTFVAFVARFAYDVLATSIALNSRSNTPLGTPLWIPQVLWFAGLCLFVITVAVLLISSLRAILRGDPRTARDLIGIPETDQEVAEEVREAEKQLASLPD